MIATKDPYALFNAARQEGPNPFNKDRIIAAEEVWGEIISDLSSINSHINQRIDQTIDEVRKKYIGKVGIVVQGDRGTGKSHTIRRIWKKIEQEGGALFSYISPCANPRRIDYHVRFHLAESLNHQDVNGITQWQKLAVATIATLKGTEVEEEYAKYLEKVDQPEELRKLIRADFKGTELADFFHGLTEAILENQSGLDFYFVKAVLFSLFKHAPISQVALSWIKGEDNPDIKKAGLPEYSIEQQETKNIWIVKQICKLAEIHSLPVIIWFDQAESTGTDPERGDSAAQIVAKCIDRIYFDCTNVVLLCSLLRDRWEQIKQMQGGIPDRVGRIVLEAKPPVAEQMIELVRMRLNWFFQLKNLNTAEYPSLYPIEESRVREVAKTGGGVRTLLDRCADDFDQAQVLPLSQTATSQTSNETQTERNKNLDSHEKKKKQLLDSYDELLTKVSIPMKEDDKLAAIILCAMRMLPESGAADVKVSQIQDVSTTSTHDLHFVVSGHDSKNNKDVTIGIRICETKNGNTFNAVMKRLLNYKKYRLTRGCLVRSTPVPLSFKKGKELEKQLVEQQGGEVVVLKKDEIKPLVALERIYQQASDYGFDREELIELVRELGLVTENRLLCEILSAPKKNES